MMPAHVTDHAVRRYAERALRLQIDETLNDRLALNVLDDMGHSVEQIRRRIADTCDLAAELGEIAVKADNGRYVLVEDRVVTFVPKHSRTRHPHHIEEAV